LNQHFLKHRIWGGFYPPLFLFVLHKTRFRIRMILYCVGGKIMARIDGRANDEKRPVKIVRHFQKYPAGSVLIEMGNTKVICAATIENHVPFFLRGTGEGWLTAEYSLLPSSTTTRTQREAQRGKQTGPYPGDTAPYWPFTAFCYGSESGR
jgi:hypothetical protein